MKLIGNDNSTVQERSANALRNMRRLINVNRKVERSFTEDFSRSNVRKYYVTNQFFLNIAYSFDTGQN